MHGDQDEIVPVAQGMQCYDDAMAEDKTLKIFEGGDHNGLSFTFAEAYNETFSAFITKCK